jgi:plasmid stabilization system protein ParE
VFMRSTKQLSITLPIELAELVRAKVAEEQLIDLYGFIAEKSSPEIAARFTDEIVTYCESLSTARTMTVP